ncbi:MAG: hybrid sensor histidine kinase/response regulator, partial [Roseimicrobium sp.]
AAISLLPSQTEAVKHVEEALAAAHKASEFTTQALRMAKDLPECIEPADMSALIRSTARIAQSGSGVNLHLNLPSDLWWAVVDSARISQVLQNLVLNGIQAMNHHGNMDVFARNVVVPPGHATLLPGPYGEVVVRDRGCGMDPTDAEQALHIPFTRKPGGNGIGLTTCRRIISDHHGHIAVSSMKNVGTEVIFWLPATQPLESKAPPPPSGEALKGLGTVLVVDDEKCLRGVVTLVLRRLGYRVFEAESGEEAIVSYRHLMRSSGEVDLVIMDLTLPGGLSGEEALQQIRELSPHAKVIASSGGLIKEHRPMFLSKGFCDILPKPYEVGDIAEVAHRVLHRHTEPKAA